MKSKTKEIIVSTILILIGLPFLIISVTHFYEGETVKGFGIFYPASTFFSLAFSPKMFLGNIKDIKKDKLTLTSKIIFLLGFLSAIVAFIMERFL